MTELEILKLEADKLGITYPKNVTLEKLKVLVDNYYKIDDEDIKKLVSYEVPADKPKAKTPREIAAEMEKVAREEVIVTITDNDRRENTYTQTVPVTCANAYFDLGTVHYPLGIPVTVLRGHLNVLKEVESLLHVMDHKTGMTNPQKIKRYSFNYEEPTKK